MLAGASGGGNEGGGEERTEEALDGTDAAGAARLGSPGGGPGGMLDMLGDVEDVVYSKTMYNQH